MLLFISIGQFLKDKLLILTIQFWKFVYIYKSNNKNNYLIFFNIVDIYVLIYIHNISILFPSEQEVLCVVFYSPSVCAPH